MDGHHRQRRDAEVLPGFAMMSAARFLSKSLGSTNGAQTCQPRATPWVSRRNVSALKGRHRVGLAPLQGLSHFSHTPRALPHCHLVKASKDADRGFRGAHASRVLVAASRRNELSETHKPGKNSAPEEPARRSAGRGAFAKANPEKSSSSRDATTNTRDACAPRRAPLRHPHSARLTKWQWGVALGWLVCGPLALQRSGHTQSA